MATASVPKRFDLEAEIAATEARLQEMVDGDIEVFATSAKREGFRPFSNFMELRRFLIAATLAEKMLELRAKKAFEGVSRV